MEQNMKKSTMIIAGMEALAAIFMLLAVKVIAPVCTGMLETAAGKQVHMKCYYTSVAVVVLAVLLLVSAVVCFVTKQKVACGTMTVAIAVCVFLILNDIMGIGICANTEMACNITAPYVKLGATAELILGAVSVFLGIKESK